MTGEHGHLQYGEQVIPYRIVRRLHKTMEIAMEPDASVVVAAPMEVSMEAVAAKLRQRAAWVVKQQRYFLPSSCRAHPSGTSWPGRHINTWGGTTD
ncbi:DUF45 domain-containing protein [Candidatus Synechococcus spongiarum]|uniref:Uncharacterized protein n=1 Tax=Candidatus Synechococcus spongiarum TaxID=431041 RepID=A0A165AEX9_9SYNE|nr:DUF45 domain-containing protein [Candidatus Synechococcus spongiarum]SAY38474.1 hypothetical protein FLM9_359 [Candidatus Synechococcus spongiarum]